MDKKIMIQAVMSLEDFAFCQDLFKNISCGFSSIEDNIYEKRIYIHKDNFKSIEHLRRIFLPDIKII